MAYYYKHPSIIEVAAGSSDEIDLIITKCLSKDLNGPVVDRTGTLNNFCEILSPIPAEATETIDFEATIDDRASQVISDAAVAGQQVRLDWSGSLPSTTILVSMCRAADQLGFSDLIVYPARRVLATRPDLYQQFITDNSNITLGTGKINEGHTDNDFITVWDDSGKHLFTNGYFNPSEIDLMFNEICDPEMLAIVQPILDKMPSAWGEQTALNSLQWLTYALKWQWSEIRRTIKSPLKPENIINFFNTIPFQQWFMQTTPISRHPELRNMKSEWPLRVYLRQFSDDASLESCNFTTGRNYNNLEAVEGADPLSYFGKICVSIDTNFEKVGIKKAKMIIDSTFEE